MASTSAGKTDPGRRGEVLALVRQSQEPLTIAQIAERLGVHPNTARFHLEGLEESGQVERVRPVRRTPGRPPLMFQAVRGMDPAGPRSYQLLAEVLVDDLAASAEAEGRAVAAGRNFWRRHAARIDADPRAGLQPAGRLVALLDALGFAPEEIEDVDGAKIGLRHCPFLELSAARGDVVCPIHLGLMQGALEEWDAGVRVERLDAFVEPDLCVAHLR